MEALDGEKSEKEKVMEKFYRCQNTTLSFGYYLEVQNFNCGREIV